MYMHPNSKHLIVLLQYLVGFDPKRMRAGLKPRPALRCPCCGAEMKIIKTRIVPSASRSVPIPIRCGAQVSAM
jgi:hypothetical protein